MVSLLFIILTGSSHLLKAQPGEGYSDVRSGVKYQLIGTYDISKLNAILNKELEDFLSASTAGSKAFADSFPTAKYNVNLYRVIYPSVVPELGNRPVTGSGLLAVPVNGSDSMPMVMYQHGTVFGKTDVPSFPDNSSETRIMIARFASQGYIIIGADYFGKGLSELPDSYLVNESTQQACVDMLFAARNVLKSMKIRPGRLFISGWSQGGWATMTYLHKLEALGIPVTAAATASAPTDIFVTMDRWINNYQPIDAIYLPACVTLQILAQEYYLQQSGLGALVIRPEYLQAARDLYSNKIDYEAFRNMTPAKLQDYFRPEFMASGNTGESPYWQTLEKSQAYRWRIHTPVNNYYGGADEVVPVFIARLPQDIARVLGSGPVTAVYAGDKADHRATFIYAVLHQKDWFDGFLKNK
jgi:pimeloyl-ACP methyl ester carboxylesterase